MKVEFKIYKRVENTLIWGASKMGIIWAKVFRVNYSSGKKYVVEYVDDKYEIWKREFFDKFSEAKKRAIEIANSKI